jgi:hypothetical protein
MLLRAKRQIAEANNTLFEAHERLAYCFEKMSGKEGSIYGLPSQVGRFDGAGNKKSDEVV